MAPKGKAKIHRPPTRFSLRLAALSARQPIDKAGPSSRTLAIPDPIIISSDSEEDLDPQGSSFEEEEPGLDPEEDNHGEDSSDKEVSEYIPEDGPIENQDPGEEEPEGPGADHEMDPNPDLEEPEEDPKEDPEEDPEMGEEEVEAVEPSDDEYNEYFANYFKLAPPPSPDSSDESLPPTDD
ncbi:hypothetical protein PIB30_057490 [Stylosanthes scabra]|uniref:Uncharacterized protein n=1 Tax=Stylosanthes scabra TaxID=79078 RepID=A0ABU6VI63_9FABA|nr:hypothetical protein [Stylosanthes scabra]